jgi:uncharacterized damage-inducible protein DinB
MDDRALYQMRRQAELSAFVNVLTALPADRVDYKPHERSPTAEAIAVTMTTGTLAACELVDNGRFDTAGQKKITVPEMPAAFEKAHAELLEKVGALDDAAWNRPIQLFNKGTLVLEQPLGEFLWFLLFDAIHHRGQLCAYLRPMGAKVPSIYGPSADTRS